LLARVGLVAYGVVHVLIGWLALQIAWGTSGRKSADTSGALRTVADEPFGRILLWLVAVGLVALALWQSSEAVWGYRNRDGAGRVRQQVTSGAKAVLYAGLGVSAASVALGSGSASSQTDQHTTSGVLAWPGGQVIIVVAGLLIIGVGVAGVVKGVRRSFSEEIAASSMSAVARKGMERLGQVGYIGKGVALGVVAFGLFTMLQSRDRRSSQLSDSGRRSPLRRPADQRSREETLVPSRGEGLAPKTGSLVQPFAHPRYRSRADLHGQCSSVTWTPPIHVHQKGDSRRDRSCSIIVEGWMAQKQFGPTPTNRNVPPLASTCRRAVTRTLAPTESIVDTACKSRLNSSVPANASSMAISSS
jgi:Domain of Unknown Function (DUF1206)